MRKREASFWKNDLERYDDGRSAGFTDERSFF
jgi:hypothetical protein